MKYKAAFLIVTIAGLLLAGTVTVSAPPHSECKEICHKLHDIPHMIAGKASQPLLRFLNIATPAPSANVDYDDLIPDLILMNPDATDPQIKAAMGIFLRVIEPMYVLAILFVAMYSMFISTTAKGRSKAKTMLPMLILGMCLVTLAPLLMKILLQLTHSIAGTILSNNAATADPLNQCGSWFMLKYEIFTWSAPYGLIFGVIDLMLWWGLFFILYIRFVILMLFTALSPVTVFFYSFELTKGLGRRMAEQTILWSTSQVAEAGAYAAIGIGWASLTAGNIVVNKTIDAPTPDINFIIGLSAFFVLILIIPMMVASFRKFLP
ncbi:MAG: hypothetical protein MSIBF_06590 [Candidatus Altiarchaeales archaeon IMC4]|nr:MAG: hypothetical protein MSIBF_06590 [Candidatus Altiarchaeales archaeon IMC4]